jgi:hypothetical protein
VWSGAIDEFVLAGIARDLFDTMPRIVALLRRERDVCREGLLGIVLDTFTEESPVTPLFGRFPANKPDGALRGLLFDVFEDLLNGATIEVRLESVFEVDAVPRDTARIFFSVLLGGFFDRLVRIEKVLRWGENRDVPVDEFLGPIRQIATDDREDLRLL